MPGRQRRSPKPRCARFVLALWHTRVSGFDLCSSALLQYIQNTTNSTISDDLAQIVGGIAKVYVGMIMQKGVCHPLPPTLFRFLNLIVELLRLTLNHSTSLLPARFVQAEDRARALRKQQQQGLPLPSPPPAPGSAPSAAAAMTPPPPPPLTSTTPLGPLMPAHLREAQRMYVTESKGGGRRPGTGWGRTPLFRK